MMLRWVQAHKRRSQGSEDSQVSLLLPGWPQCAPESIAHRCRANTSPARVVHESPDRKTVLSIGVRAAGRSAAGQPASPGRCRIRGECWRTGSARCRGRCRRTACAPPCPACSSARTSSRPCPTPPAWHSSAPQRLMCTATLSHISLTLAGLAEHSKCYTGPVLHVRCMYSMSKPQVVSQRFAKADGFELPHGWIHGVD